jgi:mono/diheme cytochrome c family protein
MLRIASEAFMKTRAIHTTALLCAVLLITVGLGLGQEKQKSKTVKKTPIQQTSAASGKEMFNSYCAACHGKEGKGDGPAASELKTAPADLSTLAKRNGGKFPAAHVTNVLRSGVKTPAHGTSDMPTWGPLFSSVSGADQAIVSMRISNLITYLESLQAK